MKLILCPECSDVRKIGMSMTFCECGKSYGFYEDDIKVLIGGKTILLGIHNQELVRAVRHRPHKVYSKKDQFAAWVIAEPCSTVRRHGVKK